MAATTQPISIAPHARTNSLGHAQANYNWGAPAASTAERTPSAFKESSSLTVHPAPIFVSGSFGSLAGTSLSFGSKLFPGCSPAGQLLNPLDPSDFKCRMSSSIESDHSSLINSHMPEREIEQCRNFACCGLPLTDLHELIEHFETHHVVVVDPSSSTYSHAIIPPRSADSSLAGALGSPMPLTGQPNRYNQSNLSLSMTGGFELDDMELDLDSESPASSSSSQSSPEANGVALPSGLPHRFNSNGTLSSVSSPPDTPMLATPVSPMITNVGSLANGAVQIQQHQLPSAFGWGAQSAAEDSFVTPTIATPNGPAAFDSVHLPPKSPLGIFSHPYASAARRSPHNLFGTSYALRNSSQLSQAQNSAALVASALNGYAGYSDYSRAFPGTLGPSSNQHLLSTSPSTAMVDRAGTVQGQLESTIPPSLLVGASASSGLSAMSGSGLKSRNPSSIPSSRGGANSSGNTPSHSRASSPSSSSASSSSNRKSAPAGPSTTLSRPASSLLLSKPFKCPKPGCMKSYKQANGLKYHIHHGQCNFNPPPELQSVEGLSEREAERRLRPFCCQVPPCQRRYKNMNGLRYHYQHSGDHGAIGLALLASGNHDATRSHSSPSPPAIDLHVDIQNPMGMMEMQSINRDAGTGAGGRSSAPTTPTVVANSVTGSRFVHSHYVTQSQPASAYASPWGSPRSGSPYQSTTGASSNGAQQVTAPIPIPVPMQAQAQVYASAAQWSAQVQGSVVMS